MGKRILADGSEFFKKNSKSTAYFFSYPVCWRRGNIARPSLNREDRTENSVTEDLSFTRT